LVGNVQDKPGHPKVTFIIRTLDLGQINTRQQSSYD